MPPNRRALLAAAGALLAAPGWSQRLGEIERNNTLTPVMREAESPNIRTTRQLILDRLGRKAEPPVRLHMRHNGSVRAAGGFQSRSYEGAPTEVAAAFLGEYRLLLGNPDKLSYEVQAAHKLENNSYVRLQQIIDGIPVLGGEVVVHVNATNAVEGLTANYHPQLVTRGDWALDKDQAIASARAAKPMTVDGDITAERFLLPRGDTAAPVWRIVFPSREPLGDWEFLVSAENGEILRVENLMSGQTQGFAFPSNPVKGRVQQVPLDNLAPGATLTGVYNKVYSYLRNLLGLVGPNVPNQFATASNGNFPYPPSDPRFSEVQLYYGMERAYARFRALGFPGFGRPLEGMALYKDYDEVTGRFFGQNNAFYSPTQFSGRGGLFFYLTPRNLDVSWDSDVIFHEYTHAVVRFFVDPFRGSVFGALNEGTADYFSDSFQDDPDSGEFVALIFGKRLPFLRTANNDNRFPENVVGEIHADGNIWSGALWDVRTRLGADRADRIAINALARMSGDFEFFDAAVAATLAAKSLYGDTVANQVADIMVSRGIGDDLAETASEAITLRSGVGVPGRISAAPPATELLGAQQFRIEVPHLADALRVQVVASGNVRFYVRYRAPIGFQNGAFVYEQLSTPGTNIAGSLTLESVPEMQKGTYYVGVSNLTTRPVDYSITATVLGGSLTANPRTTVLTPGVSAAGSAPSGPFLASRQFAIDVPSTAPGVTVSLSGDRDVDLYVKYGSPVYINSQGYPDADLVAETPGSTELVTLGTRTIPNVRPGRYYIGVYNYSSSGTARYSVNATLGGPPAAATQVRALAPDANGQVSLSPANGPTGLLADVQFAITVPANTSSLRLEVNTSLDVDILIRRGSTVVFRDGRPLFDHGFTPAPGANTYAINSDSAPPLQAGTYYVAIANWSASGGQVSVRYSLTATGPSAGPTVAAQNGVVNGGSFQPGFASASWVTILGTNLATTTRIWRDSDFIGNRLPTQLDGVSVNINGRPAYVYYISPTQINVLAPGDSTEGSVQVEVVTRQGRSNPVTVQKQRFAPAFFMLEPEGRKYIAAVHPDGTLLGKPNLFGGAVGTRPAKPGDVVLLFGTGFGPTSPPIPEGQIVTQVGRLTTSVTIRIGNVAADVAFAGVVGGGLYQFNVTIPALPNGDHTLVAEIGGLRSQANAFITIQSQ